DKEKLCKSLALNFEHVGHSALYATNGAQALSMISSTKIDVVLLDIMLGEESGIDVLRKLLSRDGRVPVIMITAYASIDTAVLSIKLGAFDYVKKPLDFDELLKTVEKACEFSRLREENRELRGRLAELSATIVTQEASMRELCRKAEKLAATDLPVLLCGESGTGKEVIADCIHAGSARSSRPMLKINCVAFPETLLDNELFGHEKGAYTGADAAFKGVFEKADGSSLFLDEIGDMPLPIQAKILRTLQNSEIRRLGGSQTIHVDVRFIAATNKDLSELIRKGLFREDLYYRLNTAVLSIPPLRERREDIPLLVDHFLAAHGGSDPVLRREVAPEVLARFLQYGWPGNVRELKNTINYALAMCSGSRIEIDDLPAAFLEGTQETAQRNIREDMERSLILRTLQGTRYNRSRSAEILKMSRKTLYNKMQRYGLTP
ncbi:MAG TPA: sigma-54 dependent transcriptional regulator, partial [Spirochaetia bacterium]|nr:sigma-54 dependent transcriptional regulator [Spirochaetia bacterium]